MNTNERIARGLGWKNPIDPRWLQCHACGTARYFGGAYGDERPVPDYEHSLDALLEPLGVLRERGWTWFLEMLDRDDYKAVITEWDPPMDVLSSTGHGVKRDIIGEAATPSEALALAVAEALEASK